MVTKLLLLAGCSAVLLGGCSAGMSGPPRVIYGPDCPPGPKPCPCEYPEFPLPPGAPYINTPPRTNTMSTPESLDLTVKTVK